MMNINYKELLNDFLKNVKTDRILIEMEKQILLDTPRTFNHNHMKEVNVYFEINHFNTYVLLILEGYT